MLELKTESGGMRASLACYRAAARSAEQNGALAAWRKLAMAVLGLSADKGSILDMAAAIAPFATDVRGETIKNCGHFQPEEQTEAVADALSRFFG
jgi:pimeloyl-ACP methyl ester carboxylesterase